MSPEKPIRTLENTSNNPEWLFASGKIEELVREGRIPWKIGMTGETTETMQPFYEVPPFSSEDTVDMVVAGGGANIYFHKDGKTKKLGTTFDLSEEQVRELESRIQAEKKIISKII
jgi:hypothetical protein